MRSDDFSRMIGARLRARREACGLSQHELAAKADLNRSSIANIEVGRQLPPLPTYALLLKALDLDPGPMLREPSCTKCSDMPPPGFACLSCGAGRSDAGEVKNGIEGEER